MIKLSETIDVNPTPIQRNANDVAIELTQLYVKKFQTEPENLEDIYARFFAISRTLSSKRPERLSNLIPEDLLSKLS